MKGFIHVLKLVIYLFIIIFKASGFLWVGKGTWSALGFNAKRERHV